MEGLIKVAKIPVNVVFQGGGAKFVLLVAAVKALQQCKDIEVKAVAGTSAGSLAACMTAFQFDVDATIKRILKLKPSLKYVHKANSWKKYYKLWFGTPLIEEKFLRDIVKAILSDDKTLNPSAVPARDVTNLKINHANIPLKILATDFINSRLQIFGSTNSTDDDFESITSGLVDVVIHSCAIPIIIRTFKNVVFKQPYIDGGICDNLPSREIFQNNYPTIGFSFAEEPAKDHDQWTITGYSQNLLSVAINRSVERTTNILGSQNVCKLPNHFDWLAFNEALAFLQSDKFDQTVELSSRWLQRWIAEYRHNASTVVRIDHALIHQALSKTLKTAYELDAPFESLICHKMICTVTANSLRFRNLPEHFDALDDDSILYSAFSVAGKPVSWLRVWDKSYKASPIHQETSLKITDRDGKTLDPLRFIVLEDEDDNEISRSIYLYFPVPLTAEKSPYKSRQQTSQHSSLREIFGPKRRDFIWMSPTNYRHVEKIVAMVHVPKDKDFFDRDLLGDLLFPDEQLDLLQSSPCSEKEIQEICEELRTTTPAGFRSIARSAGNLTRGQGIGIVVGAPS